MVYPQPVHEEFLKRLREDPILAATVMSWADIHMDTRYLYQFHGDTWLDKINAAAEYRTLNENKFEEKVE